MSDEFIANLAGHVQLTEQERSILLAVDVSSYEDLHSLVQAFPSIAQLGVDLPKLSNAAFTRVAGGWATFVDKAEQVDGRVTFGALPPAEAPLTTGASVGSPAPRRKLVAMGPAQAPIDLRFDNWPVRDQGDRGTCVSFGTTSCIEHALEREGRGADMSEQFLYWAMKTTTADPQPNVDGSWLEYSAAALASTGICKEADWPYSGAVVKPVSGAGGGAPSASASATASGFRRNAALHETNPSSAARKVLEGLNRGRPVAICLPVFTDPLTPSGQTNWTTSVGWAYGHIINPPPTSKVTSGHCVCVVGYSPDRNEPTGGRFIVRNSWSTDWGSENPNAESHAPAPGYGFVSGTYLNMYTWEILQL